MSGRIAAELTEYALDRNRRVDRGDDHGDPRCGGRRPPRHRAISSTWRPYHVILDTTHGPARGRTVCDGQPYRLRRDGRVANADVGIRIDRARFERLLIDAFAKLP